jgi:hypothetical protein
LFFLTFLIFKYQAEIPINEFPQQVRFKVSNKETVDSVIEMFPGVAITVKGTYTPPGRKAGAGERKLYIELMGYSELNVRLCKREIIRIMKETAAAQVNKNRFGWFCWFSQTRFVFLGWFGNASRKICQVPSFVKQ